MTRLKTRVGNGKILVAPGIYDGLSGLVAENAGAEAVYLSGASIAYTRFGRPDVGLVSMSEVADTIAVIRDRITVPIIVDADTGFGNAINVKRTMRQFERAGANAIQLEDQTLPKRCGHLDGKTLVAVGEMVGKIKAALDARASQDTLVVARTDAVAVEGLSAGIDRAAAYAEAGADVLFVEAPKSVEDMGEIVSRLGDAAPLMANMVEGGKTPSMTARDLEKLGFSLVIFPGGAVRAIAATLEGYYSSLVAHGSNEPFRNSMIDFAGINRIVGTPELLEEARGYDEEQQ